MVSIIKCNIDKLYYITNTYQYYIHIIYYNTKLKDKTSIKTRLTGYLD